VPAGGKRIVRVGIEGAPPAAEAAYRVFIEELPPAASASQGRKGTVAVVGRFALPVFIVPAGAKGKLAIDSAAAKGGHVLGEALEPGAPRACAWRVSRPARRTPRPRSPAPYLLAGTSREVSGPLGAGCKAGATVKVVATAEGARRRRRILSSRRMRVAIDRGVAALLLAAVASREPGRAALVESAAPLERIPVNATLNDARRASSSLARRRGHLGVGRGPRALGVPIEGAEMRAIDGRPHARVDRLEGVVAVLDEATLTLAVTVEPALSSRSASTSRATRSSRSRPRKGLRLPELCPRRRAQQRPVDVFGATIGEPWPRADGSLAPSTRRANPPA
jgi:hypothetical protein